MSSEQQSPHGEDPQGQRPVAQNPKRGCGHLKPAKGYVRSEPATLDFPAFVEIDPRLPYKEGHFRGYRHFPGIKFERAIADRVDFTPRSMVLEDFESIGDINTTGHVGEMAVSKAHDLVMWAGKTYYDPEEFIEEVREMGLSKAIPVTQNQKPPVVVPGWSRCWILHKEATDDDLPGFLGYAPISGCIYTEDEDGEVPQWAQDYEAMNRHTVVRVGEEISPEDYKNKQNHRGLSHYRTEGGE